MFCACNQHMYSWHGELAKWMMKATCWFTTSKTNMLDLCYRFAAEYNKMG